MCMLFSLIEVCKNFSAFHPLSTCCFLDHQLFGEDMMSVWMRAGVGKNLVCLADCVSLLALP